MTSPQTSSKQTAQYLVGLTGNICSGKSTAAGYFKELGARVIDLDNVVHDMYKTSWSLKYQVYKKFGLKVFNKKLEIDRKKLGRIVFSDDNKKLRDLEKIVWGRVGKEVDKRTKDKKGIIIVEAPMLYESGFHKKMDANIVVTVDEEEQIGRLMKRNNMNRAEAVIRINAQMPQSEKIKLSDYIIPNNESLDLLKRDVEETWGLLYSHFFLEKVPFIY